MGVREWRNDCDDGRGEVGDQGRREGRHCRGEECGRETDVEGVSEC